MVAVQGQPVPGGGDELLSEEKTDHHGSRSVSDWISWQDELVG